MMPRSVVTTKRGCLLSLNVRPPTYDAIWSQNTPKKNSLNESNISMKKYHHKPTLGVRSGNSRGVPYVELKNWVEPVKATERPRRPPSIAANPRICAMVNPTGLRASFFPSSRWI
jgi:hypothetical protein